MPPSSLSLVSRDVLSIKGRTLSSSLMHSVPTGRKARTHGILWFSLLIFIIINIFIVDHLETLEKNEEGKKIILIVQPPLDSLGVFHSL